MLRIEAEITVLPRHVSRINVVVFVPGNGVRTRGERELKNEDSKKAGDAANNPGPAGNFVLCSHLAGQHVIDGCRTRLLRASKSGYSQAPHPERFLNTGRHNTT